MQTFVLTNYTVAIITQIFMNLQHPFPRTGGGGAPPTHFPASWGTATLHLPPSLSHSVYTNLKSVCKAFQMIHQSNSNMFL